MDTLMTGHAKLLLDSVDAGHYKRIKAHYMKKGVWRGYIWLRVCWQTYRPLLIGHDYKHIVDGYVSQTPTLRTGLTMASIAIWFQKKVLM